MGWFKKSQFNDVNTVKSILDRNINGSIEETSAEIQSSVQNPCQALSAICNGNLVNPFYMNVWSFLCGDANENQNQFQNQEQEQPQQEAEI